MTPPKEIETAFQQAQRLLRTKGIDRYELYATKRRGLKIEVRDLSLHQFQSSEDQALQVRVLKNQRMGFSFTTSLQEDAIHKSVDTACKLTDLLPEDPFHGFAEISEASIKNAQTFEVDHAGLSASTETKTELALELERLCRAYDPRIKGVRAAGFRESHSHTWILQPNGALLSDEAAYFSANLSCKAEENGDAQMGYDFEGTRTLSKLVMRPLAERAAKSALEMLNAQPSHTRRCPVILQNDVVSELIEFLSESFSAENFDRKKSLLVGKLNEKVFSEKLNLVDDGRLPGGLASSAFDAEGVPSQTTTLIANGVFKSLLSNVYYAKKMNLPLTGNSSRGIKAPPSIGTTNLMLSPGKESLEQLMQKMGNGILITQLMGVHTANPITGDFSLGAAGLEVKNGKISHAIKGFAVAGNLLNLLQTVDAVGSDSRFFGTLSCSSLLIADLAIAGSSPGKP